VTELQDLKRSISWMWWLWRFYINELRVGIL